MSLDALVHDLIALVDVAGETGSKTCTSYKLNR